MDKYDLIILGSGPAGMTAQIYALRYNLKAFVIGEVPGGLMMESPKIENFPGESFVSGVDLTKKMQNQIKEMGGEILMDGVLDLRKKDDYYEIITKTKKSFLAKRILFALGTRHKALNLKKEKQLVGHGVAYCTTCDGRFYKDKFVAISGDGNSAAISAIYLSAIAKHVYLVFREGKLKCDLAWITELKTKKNISFVKNTNVVELIGEKKLEKIVLDRKFKGKQELKVDGLFIEIGTSPQTELFEKIGGKLNKRGYIKVDCKQKTNLPNVWAAGDITDGSNNFMQIITACAEAAIAVNSIFQAKQNRKSK